MTGRSRFQEAVESTPGLGTAYRRGKQGLNAAARAAVNEDGAVLYGSIDLDAALVKTCPNDARWDYGLAHSTDAGSDEFVTWIELHRGNPGETMSIIRKHVWLQDWLRGDGQLLRGFSSCSVWIATGGVGIPKNAPERRQLAMKGILGPCKYFRLRRSECS